MKAAGARGGRAGVTEHASVANCHPGVPEACTGALQPALLLTVAITGVSELSVGALCALLQSLCTHERGQQRRSAGSSLRATQTAVNSAGQIAELPPACTPAQTPPPPRTNSHHAEVPRERGVVSQHRVAASHKAVDERHCGRRGEARHGRGHKVMPNCSAAALPGQVRSLTLIYCCRRCCQSDWVRCAHGRWPLCRGGGKAVTVVGLVRSLSSFIVTQSIRREEIYALRRARHGVSSFASSCWYTITWRTKSAVMEYSQSQKGTAGGEKRELVERPVRGTLTRT